MRDSAYPVICGVGFVLCLISLPWHWQARSASTLIFLGWISVACVFACVNSTLWAGSIDDKAPLWCDISTRFSVGLNTGITTSGLCMQRRLYQVATIQERFPAEYSERKELVINTILGLGLPVLMLPMYYVIQPYRYSIIEDVGRWTVTYPTFMTILMFSMSPVLISSVSFVYAAQALTIRALFKIRRRSSRVLFESGSQLSLSRFFRLMAVAATDMLFSLPTSLFFLISDLLGREYETYSWAKVHEHITEVVTVTKQELQSSRIDTIGVEFSRWSIPGPAFLFFLYFGMSSKSVRQYKSIFWRLVAPLGLKPPHSRLGSQAFSWSRRPTTTTGIIHQDLSAPAVESTAQSDADTILNPDNKPVIIVEDAHYAANNVDIECQTKHRTKE